MADEYSAKGSNPTLSINEFVTKFNYGFSRLNLFRATFVGGNGLTDTGINGDVSLLSYACKSAQLPGVTFTEGKYSVKSLSRKFVTGIDYDPLAFTFLVDGNARILKLFEQWSAHIYSNGSFGFKDEYKCQIIIDLLDRKGEIVHQVKIIDAYPTNLAAIDLAWDSSDALTELSVSFNYLRFEVAGIDIHEAIPHAKVSPVDKMDVLTGGFKMPKMPTVDGLLAKLPFELPKMPQIPEVPELPFNMPKIPEIPDIVKSNLTIPKMPTIPDSPKLPYGIKPPTLKK